MDNPWLKVAIVQAKPVHFDLAQCLQKAITLIEEATAQGANLVVFGETWFTGYPAWLDYCADVAVWNYAPMKAVFARMYQQSLAIDSPQMRLLQQTAKEKNTMLVFGFNEKVTEGAGSGTIYNSFAIINDKGEIQQHHRKLMPTYSEKLLYGMGDGQTLRAVNTPFGNIGGLICWEHWMPLACQAMHMSHEQLHIALWPMVHEMHQIASRHYAFGGRCFVIAVGQMMQVNDFPEELALSTQFSFTPEHNILRGGSCIIAPNGQFLVEPQFDSSETIIFEMPSLDEVYAERMALDVTGHYNRQDVFNFSLKK